MCNIIEYMFCACCTEHAFGFHVKHFGIVLLLSTKGRAETKNRTHVRKEKHGACARHFVRTRAGKSKKGAFAPYFTTNLTTFLHPSSALTTLSSGSAINLTEI